MPGTPLNLIATRTRITALKKRRDVLLNTACTREERPALIEEVRAINREIQRLEERLAGRNTEE